MKFLSPRAGTFDAVGTLFGLRAPVGEIYLERARAYGLEASDSDLARKLTESFRRAFAAQRPLAFPNQPADRIPALEREWWKTVVEATFSPFGPPARFDAFFNDLYELFRTAEAWQLNPDARPVLETLRARGMKIGLVTNYDSRVFDVLESLGISRFFDEVAVSTLIGAAKPDPSIFLKACERLACRPDDTIHVGDDYDEDFEGATAAGLQAVLYDPRTRYRDQNLPRICTLAELLEILL